MYYITIYTAFILYWSLLMITATATFDQNNKFKVSPCENIDRPGLQRTVHRKMHSTKSNGHENKPQIPLNILMELNQVTSEAELFEKFMPHIDATQIDLLNILEYEFLNGLTSVPKAATCTIEKRTVSLRDDDNPNLFYSPSCTRVNRCGGCCGSDLVSCQPTEIEVLNFVVNVMQYDQGFTYKEKKIIPVEQHVKCKCDCVVKEKDCKSSQVYNPKECGCVCGNFDDQNECGKKPGIKVWDSENCSCRCIKEQECGTELQFNYNTCRCEPITYN